MTEGTVLFRPDFNDWIQITRIETHGRDEKGKKSTLAKPIYHLSYLLNYKPPFRTYLAEIERMILFNRWIKLKP